MNVLNDTKAYEIRNVLNYNPGGRSLLLESVSKVSSAANRCLVCAGFAVVSATGFDVFIGSMPDGSPSSDVRFLTDLGLGL